MTEIPDDVFGYRGTTTGMISTDGASPDLVIDAILYCCGHWHADARIIGNIRAGDIARALCAARAKAAGTTITKSDLRAEWIAGLNAAIAEVSLYSSTGEETDDPVAQANGRGYNDAVAAIVEGLRTLKPPQSTE